MNSPLVRFAALALVQCACSYGAVGGPTLPLALARRPFALLTREPLAGESSLFLIFR
jgi:hypothetical protein